MQTAGGIAPTVEANLAPGGDSVRSWRTPEEAPPVAVILDRQSERAARRDRVLARHVDGWSASAMARAEGVSLTAIIRDHRALGLTPNGMGASPPARVDLSLADFSREFDVPRDSARYWIKRGRLAARWGRRRSLDPRRSRGSATGWIIARADAEAFIASLARCRYPTCDRLGVGPTGCCSGPHAIALQNAGKKRPPDVVEKSAAAQRGRRRGPHAPERSAAIAAGLRRYYADEIRSEAQRAAARERLYESIRTGTGVFAAALQAQRSRGHWSGRIGQIYAGQWAGKLGGRPRLADVDPDFEAKVRELLELHARNPRLGGRSLATRVGLSHYQVRRLLEPLSVP